MASNKVLHELREDCECEKIKYCPLEAMLCNIQNRVVEQHKLVEFAKYQWGILENKDIGWDEAYMRWMKLGYAKHFAEIYSIKKSYHEMRMEMFRQ